MEAITRRYRTPFPKCTFTQPYLLALCLMCTEDCTSREAEARLQVRAELGTTLRIELVRDCTAHFDWLRRTCGSGARSLSHDINHRVSRPSEGGTTATATVRHLAPEAVSTDIVSQVRDHRPRLTWRYWH